MQAKKILKMQAKKNIRGDVGPGLCFWIQKSWRCFFYPIVL